MSFFRRKKGGSTPTQSRKTESTQGSAHAGGGKQLTHYLLALSQHGVSSIGHSAAASRRISFLVGTPH